MRYFKKNYFFLFFFSFFPFVLSAQVERPIGINLSGVHDWSTELVFTDAFKQSRAWISYQADGSGPWDTQIPVEVDEQGYPLKIPYDDGVNPPQRVRTLMLWDIEEALPVGQYRLLAQGTGRIRLRFGAEGVFDCPVDTLVEVSGGVALEIEESLAADPLRNIRFIYPEYHDTFQEQTFIHEFLDFLEDFQIIRFMDWLRTNNSPVTSWEERGRADFFTQTYSNGVAWAYVIELCNLTGKDAWINVPHRADEEYIQQLAQLLRDELDPALKIYLEYSNEVWNAQFSQHQEAAAFAQGLGYTGPEWERAWKYTAKRSADIFRIFEDTFEDDGRLVKVIPSQAANSWLSNQIITFFQDPIYNPTGVEADALAIAPYFAGSVANQIVDEGLVGSITVAEIVQRMEESLPTAFAWMEASQSVADDHGLELLVYEGGQHLVATGANVNLDELTAKLTAANHHPDLQEVYCQYLNHWYSEQGGPFMHFSSHGSYSKWGSWGVKENMEDVDNPKYLALQDCVFTYNQQATQVSEPPTNGGLLVYPNPSADGVFWVEGKNLEAENIEVFDVWGRAVPFRLKSLSSEKIRVEVAQAGWLLLRMGNRRGVVICY